MRQDWSWNHSAREYDRLYEHTLARATRRAVSRRRRRLPSASAMSDGTRQRLSVLASIDGPIRARIAHRLAHRARSVIVAENRAAAAERIRSREARCRRARVADPGELRSPACCRLPVLSRATNPRTPPAVYERIDARRPLAESASCRTCFRPSRRTATPDQPFAGSRPRQRRAIGAHEVIIESARHVDRMSALSVARAARRARRPTPSGCAIGATTAAFATAWCSRTKARGPARRSPMCTAS